MAKTLTIRRGKRPEHRGFTLIEILSVVVIIGISASVIIPQISSRDDLKAAAAARMLMADIVFAQNRAITYQANYYVQFNTTSGYYQVMTGSTPATITHPVNQTTYKMKFGSSGTYGLRDSTLFSAGFVGPSNSSQLTLGFDDLGTPLVYNPSGGITETLSSGSIVIKSGTYKLQISVTPYTGQLSVAHIP